MSVLVVCRVCDDFAPHEGGGRCARCYAWWYRHGKQFERPPSVDLHGTARACCSCGTADRHHKHGLCRPCYQWAIRHQHQWDVPPDRQRKPRRHQRPQDVQWAATGQPVVLHPPTPLPRNRRSCERCRCFLGLNPPVFQTLCVRCSKRWWSEQRAPSRPTTPASKARSTGRTRALSRVAAAVEQRQEVRVG